MGWKQLQSSTARCRSVMNAFLWALDKLNFPLGKEHVCWLKLLSLRILIRVSCKAKQVLWTSTVPRPTAFQRGHSWSATHAPRVAGWVFVAFFFFFTWINPFILASFLCPSSRQTRSWPSSVSPPQDLLEEHKLWHQFFLPWTQHTYSPWKEEWVSTEIATNKWQVSSCPIQRDFTYYPLR